MCEFLLLPILAKKGLGVSGFQGYKVSGFKKRDNLETLQP